MTKSAPIETETAPLGLREQKREATRLALIDATRRLSTATPFSQVTVEQICDAAGVSRRTFFNYFATKEDAFLGRQDEDVPADLADLFVGMMPPKKGRAKQELSPSLLDDLVDLVTGIAAQLPDDRVGFEHMKQAIEIDPRLLQVMQQASMRSMELMAALIARREGLDADDPRIRVVVTVLTVLSHRAVIAYLAADNSRSFREIYLEDIDVVRRLFTA